MPSRAQLPHAIGSLVSVLAREQRKAWHRRIPLVVDRFPEFVVAAPGADDEEEELRAAEMQDDKTKLGIQLQPAGFRLRGEIVAPHLPDIIGNRRLRAGEVVPFQPRAAQLDTGLWRHEFWIVAIGGVQILQSALLRGAVVRHVPSSNWRKLVRRCALDAAGLFRGAPQIPAGDGAIGPPALAVLCDDLLAGKLALAEGVAEALADAVVVDRQDIGAAEAE